MAVLNGCCCCSLKTGAIIIGLFYLAFALISIGTTGNSLAKGNYYDADRDHALHELNKFADGELVKTFKEVASSYDNTFGTNVSKDVKNALNEPQVTKTQLITSLVIGVVQALCALMLLIGACQDSAGLLMPWVVVESIVVVIVVIVGIVLCIGLFAAESTVTAGIVVLVSICIYIALSIYFIMVVYSLYQNLRDTPRRYV